MSAWAHYVAFVKKYLNSRWSKSASKEIYLTSIPPIFFLFDPFFCLFPPRRACSQATCESTATEVSFEWSHHMISYTDTEKLEQSTDANLSFKKLLSKCKPQLVMKGDCLIRFRRERQKERERVYKTAAKRRTIGSLRDTSFKTDFPFFEISGLLS